ncbi:hypothetical protein V8G54_000916 [Vigna mungo]|uniref:Uncharacterized protein n=1 Tax=Vigna mungo TaxID=3915 RepID=A0AAQ3P7Z2_VIGMU
MKFHSRMCPSSRTFVPARLLHWTSSLSVPQLFSSPSLFWTRFFHISVFPIEPCHRELCGFGFHLSKQFEIATLETLGWFLRTGSWSSSRLLLVVSLNCLYLRFEIGILETVGWFLRSGRDKLELQLPFCTWKTRLQHLYPQALGPVEPPQHLLTSKWMIIAKGKTYTSNTTKQSRAMAGHAPVVAYETWSVPRLGEYWKPPRLRPPATPHHMVQSTLHEKKDRWSVRKTPKTELPTFILKH